MSDRAPPIESTSLADSTSIPACDSICDPFRRKPVLIPQQGAVDWFVQVDQPPSTMNTIRAGSGESSAMTRVWASPAGSWINVRLCNPIVLEVAPVPSQGIAAHGPDVIVNPARRRAILEHANPPDVRRAAAKQTRSALEPSGVRLDAICRGEMLATSSVRIECRAVTLLNVALGMRLPASSAPYGLSCQLPSEDIGRDVHKRINSN